MAGNLKSHWAGRKATYLGQTLILMKLKTYAISNLTADQLLEQAPCKTTLSLKLKCWTLKY
jgi:hypothetical protein